MTDLLVTELLEETLLESGQFILGDLDAMALDFKKFWIMTRRVLDLYQKHMPKTKLQQVTVTGTAYTFQEDSPDGIPEWVSQVKASPYIPGVYVAYDPLSTMISQARGMVASHSWEYLKPTLNIAFSGNLDVTCHYKYPIEMEEGDTKVLTEVIIKDMERDDTFSKLVLAKFLETIGRSRRSFILTDVNVTIDADAAIA